MSAGARAPEAKVSDFYEVANAARRDRNDAVTTAQMREHREKQRQKAELRRDALETLAVVAAAGIAILFVLWCGDRL